MTADEDGSRLFLSDSNHHRIIICDGNGKILDCVCMEFVLDFKYLDLPVVFRVVGCKNNVHTFSSIVGKYAFISYGMDFIRQYKHLSENCWA